MLTRRLHKCLVPQIRFFCSLKVGRQVHFCIQTILIILKTEKVKIKTLAIFRQFEKFISYERKKKNTKINAFLKT